MSSPLQMFFIIEGAVHVTVCDNAFVLPSGGMFMVPRGSTYSIDNLMDRDVILFLQARYPTAGEVSDPNMTLVDGVND
ncbi:hypothetical protein B0H13DRAFT_2316054 [Mycena leptocephala]|nr:hypothetical protein B0H13DRAFT_2316054 [Mycena leptocephala]